MLRSMTGFGAGNAETEDYKVHIEVKSVNQRYLDLNIHMPGVLNPFEEALRRKAREHLARGKADVGIAFLDKREKSTRIQVDRGLALAYHKALNEISDLLRLPRPDEVAMVAAYPDVLKVEKGTDSMEGCQELLLAAMEEALRQLVSMREAEGASIQRDFEQRILKLESFVEKIAELAPDIVAHYRERLQKTIQELLGAEDIDPARIIQETAIYADKSDYTEEIVRLRSHFQQFRRIIQSAREPVGRKLDFLIQEMNREINTVASKANSTEAAQLAVEAKSEIEKLREQAQNIE